MNCNECFWYSLNYPLSNNKKGQMVEDFEYVLNLLKST